MSEPKLGLKQWLAGLKEYVHQMNEDGVWVEVDQDGECIVLSRPGEYPSRLFL